MKRIACERPRIDRIPRPWLVARFVGEFPEFPDVPAGDVMRSSLESGEILDHGMAIHDARHARCADRPLSRVARSPGPK